MAAGQRHGWLRLSGLCGYYAYDQQDGVPAGTVVDLYCPSCQGALRGASSCLDCGAPLAPLLVQSGAILQLCTRLGCRSHSLDLSGVNA
jgi:hypothetical protein